MSGMHKKGSTISETHMSGSMRGRGGACGGKGGACVGGDPGAYVREGEKLIRERHICNSPLLTSLPFI